MRLGSWPCRLVENSFAYRAYGVARDPRAPPPSLRIQPRVRGASESRRPAHYRRNARRHLRRNLRTGGPPVVPGLPVPPRVQIQTHGAASAVQGVHRGVLREPAAAPDTRLAERTEETYSQWRLSSRSFGRGQPLVLIAGPCVIESEEHVHFMAHAIRAIGGRFRLQSLLRQGQSHQRRRLPRPRPARRPAHSGRREGRRLFDPDRHPRAVRRPSRSPKWPTFCRSRPSCAARPTCCWPPAAPGGSSTSRRGNSWRRTTSTAPPKKWLPPATPGGIDRARLVVRLQQPGGGHARPEDHAGCRLASGLRRHALACSCRAAPATRRAASRSSSSRWRARP